MVSSTNGKESFPTPQGNRGAQRSQKRTFAVGSLRFQCSRRRLVDTILDCVSWSVEGFVYLLGPVLIILALSIITLITYTFFGILIPMMAKKYELHPYKHLILAAHCNFAVFLLYNILFNYAQCVLQRHTGPQYDRVVRELAEATEFDYPENADELAAYKREYSNRMILRMRRRKARADQDTNGSVSSGDHSSAVPEGMTKRRNGSAAATSLPHRGTAAKRPVRGWMFMGPYEWGYCSSSNQPKPPRSHYDHVTRSLVLNLDHYCPWMFNAVGYFNYRYFLNFLIYIVVGMTYGTALMLEPFLLSRSPEYHSQAVYQRRVVKEGLKAERMLPMLPFHEEKMLLTLSFMLCAAVGIATLLLGGLHVYLTLTAQTTIEFHGNWTARKRARAAGQKWKNPYSSGSCIANWQQVYGTCPLLLSVLPSRREREYLPVPLPGRTGCRMLKAADGKGGEEDDDNVILCDTENQLSALLKSANVV